MRNTSYSNFRSVLLVIDFAGQFYFEEICRYIPFADLLVTLSVYNGLPSSYQNITLVCQKKFGETAFTVSTKDFIHSSRYDFNGFSFFAEPNVLGFTAVYFLSLSYNLAPVFYRHNT